MPLNYTVGEPMAYRTSASSDAPKMRPLDADKDASIALIVYHGMGQQLPFETTEMIVEAIEHGQSLANASSQPITTRQVTLNGHPFTRVEMTLTDQKGQARNVHIYECYWAPLTEGQINLAETTAFLLDAGRRGFLFSLADHPFSRWMFGSVNQLISKPPLNMAWFFVMLLAALGVLIGIYAKTAHSPTLRIGLEIGEALRLYTVILQYKLLRPTARYLLFALMVVLALVGLNMVIGLVAAKVTLLSDFSAAKTWPSETLRSLLALDLLTLLCLVGLWGGLGIGLPLWYRGARRRPKLPERFPRLDRFCMGVMLGAIILMGMVIPWHAFLRPLFPAYSGIPAIYNSIWQHCQTLLSLPLVQVFIWAAALFGTKQASNFLIQYLGDVAIYVSAHRLSRFSDVRNKIRQTASDVTCSVFSTLHPDEPRLFYRDVTLVGHSLGSVIAYDALNAAVTQDNLEGGQWQAAKRTRLFLTFGSPLDKIAFLFRSQGEEEGTLTREVMASTVQPLITNAAWRPQEWINFWSPDDWISGELTFFDPQPPDKTRLPAHQCVKNERDLQAWVPAACHTHYWENDLMPSLLYNKLVE